MISAIRSSHLQRNVPATPDLPQTEIAIVEITNAFRKENKLGEVKANPALMAAAKAFAHYLAKTGKFAHEADGREPSDRAAEHGYRYCLVAENLALNLDSRGFETRRLATAAMDGWKKSPGHRANLLRPGATEIGVAVAKAPDPDPKFISVQLLGRPEALKVKFRIDNRSGARVSYRLGERALAVGSQTIALHEHCGMEPLRFEVDGKAQRFEPRDGDVYVVSGEAANARVEVKRR